MHQTPYRIVQSWGLLWKRSRFSCSSLAATLSKLFETASSWGLYETSSGHEQAERWLDPRHTLSWYLPLAGTLEWKEQVRVAELVFLNGTRTRVRIDDSLSVGRILQTVGHKLGLTANAVCEYGVKLGGQLSEGLGDKDVLTGGWLDPRLSLQQHGVKSATRLELKWLKRFFVSDHSLSSSDEVALHYSFLECRNSFLTDVLDTSGHTVSDVAQCAACLLHVDHGRFDKKKHTQQWYAGKRYVPESWSDMCNFSLTAAAWKQLGEEAAPKKTFVDLCQKFPGFASTFFENVALADKTEAYQVAVSMEKVVLYNLKGLPSKSGKNNQRRLSRAALALSPRGGGGGASLDETEAVAASRRFSRSSSSNMGRRGSIMHSKEDVAEEGEGDGATAAQSVATTPGSESKSPRGLLSRTFTLRRDKKSSSPNLLNSSDSLGGATDQRTITKSGRFKSFAGLRDLSLLKRGNSKAEGEQHTTLAAQEGAPLTPVKEERSGDESDSLTEGLGVADSTNVVEGRKEVHSVLLEEIVRWGVRSDVVVLEVAGKMPSHSLMEFKFVSSEIASDFSELLRGYCSFRLEDESPASWAAASTEFVADANSEIADGAGSLSLRPPIVLLVGELLGRLMSRWESVPIKPAEVSAEMEKLAVIVTSVLKAGASTSNTLCGRALQSVARLVAVLPSEFDAVRDAANGLVQGLVCAFPPELDEEPTPNAALDRLRDQVFTTLAFCSALSNGFWLSRMETAASLVDKVVESILVLLDESVKRPSSAEAHVRLMRSVLCCAPRLAESIKLAKQGPNSAGALGSCARLCRDALSELVAVCAAGSDELSGLDDEAAVVDGHVKALWEIEGMLRAMKDVDAISTMQMNQTVASALQSCYRLVDTLAWSDVHAAQAVKSLYSVATMEATRRSTSSCGRLQELVLLLADTAPVLASFMTDVWRFGGKGRSCCFGRLLLEERLNRVSQCLFAGSLHCRLRVAANSLTRDVVLLASPQSASASGDQRSWEESWKTQTIDLSALLKAFKSTVRAAVQLDGAAFEGLCNDLRFVVGKIGVLVAPFLSWEGAVFVASWTAIVRTVQLLAARLVVFVRAIAAADWSGVPSSSLSSLQNDLAVHVDGCLSALNANNPALAQLRPSVWGGTTEAWKRRGEISSQGAALKLKLAKNKLADKKFLTVSRKKAEPASVAGDPALSRTSSGSLSKIPPVKTKRTSGEWEDQ